MRSNKRKSGKYENRSGSAAPKFRGKSVLALCLLLIVAASLTIGGTLAFLKNESGTVTNTFRAGQIQYKLNLKANAALVDHDDGDVAMPTALDARETTSLSVTFGADKTPVLTGYTFGGWYYDAACTDANLHTTAPGTSITVNYGDEYDSNDHANKVEITLYAKWTANTDTPYTVRHWVQNLNAGEEHTEANFALRETENLTGTTNTEVTPAVKNYEGFTAPATQTVTILGDGSTVVDYYYTRNSYIVTLNKGTGIETVTGAGTFQYGASVTIDATLKTGYKWANWTGDHNTNTQKYTFTMPANDVVDTANGTPITYTVKFNGNEADSGQMDDQTFTYDVAQNLTDNAYGRSGYDFLGWSTDKDATTATYADQQEVVNLTTVDGAEITLYAIWERMDFTVTFDPNATDATAEPTSKTVTYGQAYGNLAEATRPGYTLEGWYLDQACTGNKVTSTTTVAIAEDHTLFAKWTPNTYIVHYNNNGGSGTMADQTFTYDIKDYLKANTFTKKGYEFIGWALTSNGDVKYTDKEFVSNLTTKNEITLYAVWNAGSIVVTFDSGYADAPASPRTQMVTYDKAYGTLATAPEIEGYRFLGWYTQREGKGTKITSSSIVKNDKNHTLYAHWETPQIDFLLMFPGSGTKNFDSFVKHDYTFNKGITYTGQTHQGSWESFSIRLSDLVVGGTYQLKFDAAFSDRTCIRGYNTKYESNDNSDYPIGCTVSDESKYAENGSTGGSDMYDWKPTNAKKSTKGFVIEFVATEENMFWLWELSKIRNPGETYLPDWKEGKTNFKESYFDLTLSNVSLTLMPPDIQFEKTTAPTDNVKAFKRNKSTNTSVDFNLTGGSGKFEKAYTPITDLIVGKTYTVNFDLTTNAHGGSSTKYHFHALIGPNKCDTNDNEFPNATRVWNGDSFITGSGTRKTSGSFNFKATKRTMYWIWDMTTIANDSNYNYLINATIELKEGAKATSLTLFERPLAELPEGVSMGDELILTTMPDMAELEASVARENMDIYGWAVEGFFGTEIVPAEELEAILEGVFADAAEYGDEVALKMWPLYTEAKPEPETEPSTEATEPSTEATEPSTEATEPSTEATEPSTEATEASTEETEPSGDQEDGKILDKLLDKLLGDGDKGDSTEPTETKPIETTAATEPSVAATEATAATMETIVTEPTEKEAE